MSKREFLQKIHGLRGLSIILVLMFHFFEKYFRGGYLGVDIFFVISGFIVSKASFVYWPKTPRESWQFLKTFYVNRVARLLPTGLFVAGVSLLFALYLTSDERLTQTLNFFVSSFAGFANVYLYLTGGNYFGLSQEFNFFTQAWSLGVEEQFYVLYSLLIFLAPLYRKKFTVVFTTTTAVSLLSNLSFLRFNSHEAHFYLIPFRFWEMGLGVILFLHQKTIKEKLLRMKRPIEVYSWLALIATFFIKYSPNSFPFPILVIIFPAVIYIITTSDGPPTTTLDRFLHSRFLDFFGTISYSLYLIHWPVVVLMKYLFGKGVLSMLTGLCLSVVLAKVINLAIEIPANRLVRKKSAYAIMTVLAAAIIAVGPLLFYKRNILYIGQDYAVDEMQWKQEFKGCIETSSDLEKRRPCFFPKTQKTHVIYSAGDSHAGQIAIMLKEFARGRDAEVVLMHSGDKANSIHSVDARDWKEKPVLFEHIKEYGKPGDIAVFTFASYHWTEISESIRARAEKVWSGYIRSFLEKGIEVVLVIDSPYYEEYPIESCIFDQRLHIEKRCSMNVAAYLAQRQNQESFFKSLREKMPRIKVWDMKDEFCDKKCRVFSAGKLNYFDYNHISLEKAKALASSFTKFYEGGNHP